MLLSLIDLEVDVDYERIPVPFEDGMETSINITSVKSKGIELITLLTPDEVQELSERILIKES